MLDSMLPSSPNHSKHPVNQFRPTGSNESRIWMARRFGWISQFGAAMDPVADKLLVAVTFIIFTLQGYIPIWVAAIVLGRDAVILAGAGAYRLFFEPIEFSPSFISKANTATQIVMLLMLLLHQRLPHQLLLLLPQQILAILVQLHIALLIKLTAQRHPRKVTQHSLLELMPIRKR